MDQQRYVSTYEDEKEQELDIFDLAKFLLKKFYIVVVLALAGFAVAFCYARFVKPVTYTSSVQLYVKNADDVVSSEIVSSSDLSAAQKLVATYVVILKNDMVIGEVSDMLIEKYGAESLSTIFTIGEDYDKKQGISKSQLLECITMSSVDETEVLQIQATTPVPEISADICNFVAYLAPESLVSVIGAGSVEIMADAKPAVRPNDNGVKKLSVIGFAFGFVLACAIVFLMYIFDRTIYSSDKVCKKCGFADLAHVCAYRTIGTDGKKTKVATSRRQLTSATSAVLLSENPPFAVKEEFISLRTNIVFALAPYQNKIFAVTSGLANEGKSTIAANLAISMAESGKKILLIDADMRKPVQNKIFKVDAKSGFATCISRLNTIDEVIRKNVVENLDVIPCGPIPPNPSELLSSEATKEILSELAEKYDYIIIDTPPVNVVSDVLVLSDIIAGIVLVSRYGISTYDEVDEVKKRVVNANARVLGYVLNGVPESVAGYGKYGKYGKYEYANTSGGSALKNTQNKSEASKQSTKALGGKTNAKSK